MSSSSSPNTASVTSTDTEKLSPNPSSCASSNRRIDNPGETAKSKECDGDGYFSRSRKSKSPSIPVDVLTPPREEDAFLINDTKCLAINSQEIVKPKGHLKFFKDGRLCLELALHDGDGISCTKWVQTKARTMFPPIVRITKEAKIPCQSLASALFPISQRNTSSSGSGNEENSSVSLRSPGAKPSYRLKPKGWRKIVAPRREISSQFTFYMRRAKCTSEFVKLNPHLQKNAQKYLHRRPLNNLSVPETLTTMKITDNNVSSVSCDCNSSERIVADADRTCSHLNDHNVELQCNAHSAFKKPQKCIENVLMRLSASSEPETKSVHDDPDTPPSKYFHPRHGLKVIHQKYKKATKKTTVIASNSQKKSHVLSVPDVRREGVISRQKNSQPMRSSPYSVPLAFSEGFEDHTKHNRQKKESRTSGTKTVHEYFDSNLNVLGSSKVLAPNFIDFGHLFNQSLVKQGQGAISSIIGKTNIKTDSLEKFKEASYLLQQQTVKKAISYTINSLLGTNGISESHKNKVPCSITSKFDNQQGGNRRCNLDNESSSSMKKRSSKTTDSPPIFELNIQDQNSFLRHLLDSSDPIPSTIPSPEVPNSVENLIADKAKSNSDISSSLSCPDALSKYKRKSPKQNNVELKRAHLNKCDSNGTTIYNMPEPVKPKASHKRVQGDINPLGFPTPDTAFHRQNACTLRSPFLPMYGKTQVTDEYPGPSSTSNCETALNLCQREQRTANQQIMDLSYSAMDREFINSGSNKEMDVYSDNDKPLDLCKNSKK